MKQAPIADGGHTYTLRAAQAASAGRNHAHLPAMSLACCRDGCHQKSLEYLVKHGRTVKHGPDGVKVVAFAKLDHTKHGRHLHGRQNSDDVSCARRWPTWGSTKPAHVSRR